MSSKNNKLIEILNSVDDDFMRKIYQKKNYEAKENKECKEFEVGGFYSLEYDLCRMPVHTEKKTIFLKCCRITRASIGFWSISNSINEAMYYKFHRKKNCVPDGLFKKQMKLFYNPSGGYRRVFVYNAKIKSNSLMEL